MKLLIQSLFQYLGLTIMKASTYKALTQASNPSTKKIVKSNTMQEGLQRAKQREVIPHTIIDVGAAQGKWSLMASQFWKDANFVLFEPLEERRKFLKELVNINQNFIPIHKGAGDKEKTIDFYKTADLDGSGIADNGSNSEQIEIEVTTLDKEINNLNLEGPYLIKLDTHGYEVPILEGATETLNNTNLVIIECYGYHITPESLLFHEMCQLMLQKGFRLVDIVDVMHRPKDKTFWQCDAFFAPTSDKNFNYNTYHFQD